MEGQRRCVNCGLVKCIDDFYRKGSRRDSACKVCILQKKRKCYKRKQKVASRRRGTLLDFDVFFVGAPDLSSLSRVLKGYLEDGQER